MPETTGTVFVVDDDAGVRKAVSRLLRSAGFRVEAYGTANEFLRDVRHEAPACLVLDVKLPGLNGLELQAALQDREQTVPIVFITGHGDIPMGVRAMKAGAVDFLPKPFENHDLLRAVQAALARDARAAAVAAVRAEVLLRADALSPREREVLRYVITGMLNKQIAAELGIAEKTVKVHRGRVFSKLGVQSVAELVRLAQQAGIPPAEVA